MVTNAGLVARIEAIERELALIREALSHPPKKSARSAARRKSLRGVMKGRVEIEDVKAVAREIFEGKSHAYD